MVDELPSMTGYSGKGIDGFMLTTPLPITAGGEVISKLPLLHAASDNTNDSINTQVVLLFMIAYPQCLN
jgi:hypothetical protein